MYVCIMLEGAFLNEKPPVESCKGGTVAAWPTAMQPDCSDSQFLGEAPLCRCAEGFHQGNV